MRVENLKRLTSHHMASYAPNYLEHYYLFNVLKKTISKYAKGKLIDIGCGNKPYQGFCKGLLTEYIGCDIVQSSSNCVDVICEATKITLQDCTFDTALSTQTIEHIGNFQDMLNEAYRLLKPGGHFIVTGPMYWPLHEEPYDFYRFTKHGFSFSLEKAGFTSIEVIPMGGKWALLGQVILHTLPLWVTFPKAFKWLHNKIFIYLDNKYFDPINTMNYVAIGKK